MSMTRSEKRCDCAENYQRWHQWTKQTTKVTSPLRLLMWLTRSPPSDFPIKSVLITPHPYQILNLGFVALADSIKASIIIYLNLDKSDGTNSIPLKF